jgi:hypothetical protein
VTLVFRNCGPGCICPAMLECVIRPQPLGGGRGRGHMPRASSSRCLSFSTLDVNRMAFDCGHIVRSCRK